MTHEVQDIREISVFISHIRFSLCIAVAIVLLMYYTFKEKNLPVYGKILALSTCVWLLAYLFIAQTLTGIVLFFFVAVAYVVYILICRWDNKTYRWSAAGVLLLLAMFVLLIIGETWRYFHVDNSQYEALDLLTENGNPYTHNMNSMVENGSLTGVYVCEEEMNRAWAVRSEQDMNDPMVRETLIRYLNSCHLRKDSAGVMALSEQDICNVEQGIANVDYTSRFGLRRALYPIYFSIELYRCTGTIQNSTLLQRVEYMSAAWKQIQKHWGLGVGLGNHKTAVSEQLVADGSSLCEKERIGCHNQWLTFWLMGGVVVPIAFLILLVGPYIEQKKKISFVYVAFFIIVVGSMFTEDTLETQAGLTLFSIMNSILLYGFNLNQYENA